MLCGRVRWARVGPWCVDLDRSLDQNPRPVGWTRSWVARYINAYNPSLRITVYAVSIKAFSGLIHTVPQLSIFIITRYSAISTDIAFLCVFMRIYTSVSAHYISDIKHVGRNPRELNPQIESPSRDSRSYKFRLSPFLRRARGVYSVYSFVAVLADRTVGVSCDPCVNCIQVKNHKTRTGSSPIGFSRRETRVFVVYSGKLSKIEKSVLCGPPQT